MRPQAARCAQHPPIDRTFRKATQKTAEGEQLFFGLIIFIFWMY